MFLSFQSTSNQEESCEDKATDEQRQEKEEFYNRLAKFQEERGECNEKSVMCE